MTGQLAHRLRWYGLHFQEDHRERLRKCYLPNSSPRHRFHNKMSQIGNSLFDAPGSEKVAALLEKAKKNNVKVVFPVDYITADKFDKDANVRFTGVILWGFLL